HGRRNYARSARVRVDRDSLQHGLDQDIVGILVSSATEVQSSAIMARIDQTLPVCATREHPDAASSVRPPAARFFYGRSQVPGIFVNCAIFGREGHPFFQRFQSKRSLD